MLSTRDQRITFVFMLVVTVIVIAFDICMWRRGTRGTISVISRDFFRQHTAALLAFVYWLGVLTGHLFPPE